VPIEVQIRTKEMDELASRGVAAHWLYKSSGDDKPTSYGSYDRANRWIKRLLEIQQHTNSSVEFVENVKIDLFRDEVYVFTPNGEIIELPAGSTPVDFAYGVHTQVGNTCVACRINDRPAPLSQPLESGQKVKVITSEKSQPNPNWLNFVITAKARSAIRHYLKNQRHTESIELGKRMLIRALTNNNIHFEKLTGEQLKSLQDNTGCDSLDTMYERIGLGEIATVTITKILSPETSGNDNANTTSPITIDSADSLLISFARCCRPIPGDPVIAHLSSGKGMVVHRETCKNVSGLRSKNENISDISWSSTVEGEFLTQVRVEVKAERGIIASLATRIANTSTSIEGIQVDERDAEHSVITLTIEVNSRVHLANVMRSVRNMRSVESVSRPQN